MTELEIIHHQLANACCPEDVFGRLVSSHPKPIDKPFRDLAKVVHPDHNKAQSVLAEKTFARLTVLKTAAEERMKEGTYGKRLPLPECEPVEIGKYKVKRQSKVGDVADVYEVIGLDAVLKIARHHDDNDLLRAEAASLRLLDGIKPPVNDGVPRLLDSFQIDGTWKRQANVLSNLPGFVTAETVKSRMTVDARTAVWMFKRILVLLTWAHHYRCLHGAILPPHVLFYPDNDGNTGLDPRKHSIRLIDWCYSVDFTARTRLSSWVPAWESFYPPEVISKKGLDRTADFYMAARLIEYLAGPMPEPFALVLAQCTHDTPAKRFQNAGDVFDAWKAAAKSVYGLPKWHSFDLPK